MTGEVGSGSAGSGGSPEAIAFAGLSAATRTWFSDSFVAPTPAQAEAWAAINAGEHALVVAPTGSGKTLAAFLAALDSLLTAPGEGCRVLYVSPLKALAVDVERNLRAPLRGITQAAGRTGQAVYPVRVGVRSGDTSAGDRRRLVRQPPDILITTPESLFLMLSSGARETLRGVRTVILDEIHVLAATKRGAHLALSLERLEELTTHPVQRIGLSATVRPPQRVAEFLHASAPVRVIAPPAQKRWNLEIAVPVDDLAEPAVRDDGSTTASIWPHIEEQILDLVVANRSTIVFANSRRVAERLTAHLNERWAERLGVPVPEDVAPPASVMAQSTAAKGYDGTHHPVLARAHHGSVSREQREVVEDELKSGRLPCVVATSSLELGIDMGAVDVVVQVGSPPSVASGLQRVGRAGHQVGAESRGVFFPTHRGDLVESALVVDRMRAGAIEEVGFLENPLDVLAQHIVAITAGEPIEVDRLFQLIRRSAHFTRLPRSVFEAVLDMLAGRYPSEDFAELRPRLVWDRDQGVLTARPGAQRLAITSGGTIPDRGLFGVFLVGEGASRRVGELDEEMVYESRVGDVFTLGTTSWRIENITHDQVQVSPAPGQPGRLPFWKGDAPGRPAELGVAQGAFLGALGAGDAAARESLTRVGLDTRATDNLLAYLADQTAATGVLPTDTTIVVERFRDALGDWQVCVHSALGTPVLAAWALAITHSARERFGMDIHASATNDGIVIRVPDTDGSPPGAELVQFDPGELARIVTGEVGGSALFAARFRECAARALLLPRRDPRQRSPLWQQRLRAAQLLSVAARYPDFPIVLETMRECLHDVFDLPALEALHRRIAAREVRVVEVETPHASPFARSLLFGYVGEFLYEGDSPLAERKAAALSLDSSLLAELLGTDQLVQLLDPVVIAEVEAELQWLAGHRRATTPEALFDMIRTIGPLTGPEISARTPEMDGAAGLRHLLDQRRVLEVRFAGIPRFAVVEDLPRLVDGLGMPAPPGFGVTPATGDPIEDLMLRHAHSHGPFTETAVAQRFGLGIAVVGAACRSLQQRGTLVRGRFHEEGVREDHAPGSGDVAGAPQWCHHRVLALIKRRTLATLRAAVEPVEQRVYARFLPGWQSVGSNARGIDAVAAAVDQLTGCALPASMLETVILPARVADYSPTYLDELLAAGEITWTGDGALGSSDGWIRLWPTDLVAPPEIREPASPAATELLQRLRPGGGWFFEDLIAGSDRSRREWEEALWELVWAGQVRSDTFAPIRALATAGTLKSTRPARPRTRAGLVRATRRSLRPASTPTTAGRWAATAPAGDRGFTEQLLLQLDRYGVLTRGSVLAEQPGGQFAPTYRALSKLEETGQCLRGYFIDGLGAAQFATAATVDRLRAQEATDAIVLAATDPANAYGAALPWPAREGHRPGRRAGALVVLVNGELIFYLERGARTLLTFPAEDAENALRSAAQSLTTGVGEGRLPTLTVERVDGLHVFDSGPVRAALEGAGFMMTPQGLRIRA